MNPFLGDAAARCYAAGRLNIHPEMVRRIAWALGETRPNRALDIGCGTGLSTAPLHSVASRVVGIDASAAMLAEASKRTRIAWVRGRGETLPFRARAFNLVTMGFAFHWCEPVALLAELRRVLAPAGHLAVYDHHLAGHMEGELRFTAWFESYCERFPTPPRHPVFESTSADGFIPVSSERFQHLVPLTREALARYVCSQSNVLAVVEGGGTTMEAAEAEMAAGLEPFFAGRSPVRVTYRGVLDVLGLKSGDAAADGS